MFDPDLIPVIYEYVINTKLVAMAFIYWKWLSPFVREKRAAIGSAAAYAVLTAAFNFPSFDTTFGLPLFPKLFYIIPVIVLYLLDKKRNPLQKVFLCSIFMILRWLVIEIFSELGFFERDLAFALELFRTSIPAILAEMAVWWLIDFFGTLLLLYYSLVFLQRIYRKKYEELSWRELIMLLAPISLIIAVKPIIRDYYTLWMDGIGNGSIQENIPGDFVKLLYCILSYAVLLVVISFYEQIKESREEEHARAMTGQQVTEMESHIRQVESLYDEMRSYRHDMGNHLTVLTGLLNRGDHKEAVNYIEKLTGSLKTFEPSVKTGNAVTDVILSEYAEGFEKAGLDFRPSFRFPEGMSVNAFDVSVILNNALQNALENGKRFVTLSSLQKGNVYLLDIRNGIDKKREADPGTGIPGTTKKEEGHGYGLSNIRNVALRYKGDIDIRQEEGEEGLEFVLIVMLVD